MGNFSPFSFCLEKLAVTMVSPNSTAGPLLFSMIISLTVSLIYYILLYMLVSPVILQLTNSDTEK